MAQVANPLLMVLLAPIMLETMGITLFKQFIVALSVIGAGTIFNTALSNIIPFYIGNARASGMNWVGNVLNVTKIMAFIFLAIAAVVVMSLLAFGRASHLRYEILVLFIAGLIASVELIDYTIGVCLKVKEKYLFDVISDVIGRVFPYVVILTIVNDQSKLITVITIWMVSVLVRVIVRYQFTTNNFVNEIYVNKLDSKALLMNCLIAVPVGLITFVTGSLDRVAVGFFIEDSKDVIGYILGSQIASSVILMSGCATLVIGAENGIAKVKKIILVNLWVTIFGAFAGLTWAYISYPNIYWDVVYPMICMVALNFILLTSNLIFTTKGSNSTKKRTNSWWLLIIGIVPIPMLFGAAKYYGVGGVLVVKLATILLFSIWLLITRNDSSCGLVSAKS